MFSSYRVTIEQHLLLIEVPHAFIDHLQLLAWLPYFTTLANDLCHPLPEGSQVLELRTARELDSISLKSSTKSALARTANLIVY